MGSYSVIMTPVISGLILATEDPSVRHGQVSLAKFVVLDNEVGVFF